MSKLFSLKAAFFQLILTGLKYRKIKYECKKSFNISTKNLLLYVVENSIVFAGPNV